MPSHYNKNTTGENHAQTKQSSEQKLWDTMKNLMKDGGKGAKKVRRGSLDEVEKFMRENNM